MFRKKMSRGKSRRLFSKTARNVKSKNFLTGSMRGGIRL